MINLGEVLEATGADAALNKLTLKPQVKTTAICMRAALPEGKITLDGDKQHVFDLFYQFRNKLQTRHVQWLPFKRYRNGGIYGGPLNGKFAQVTLHQYTCLTCQDREGTGVPTDTHKVISSLVNNELERAGLARECKVCGSTSVVEARENNNLLPALRPTPHAGLEAELANLPQEPAVDVLPEVFGVFHEDEVPGTMTPWVPTTPLELELVGRQAAHKRAVLPLRMFRGMKVPQIKGLTILCSPLAIGRVPNADLYKNGRDKSDPLNRGYFRQFLLGVPQKGVNEV